MLSIDFIRQNKEKVLKGAKNKGLKVDLNNLLDLDEHRRKLLTEIQAVEAQRNRLTKEEGLKLGKELKEKLAKLKYELVKIEQDYKEAMFKVPNMPAEDVKAGADERENEVVKKYKEPIRFDFEVKDHLKLGEILDIIDVKRAAKVSGSRFGYFKNQAVILEFALVQMAFSILIKEGFTTVVPPVLIKKEITEELGYWQAEGHQDYYLVAEPEEKGGLYLVGTSEHSVVPMHKDEILEVKNLPKRYVAFSSCFRREAGSYGKDVHGVFRVHQFDKVEMVSFTNVENGDVEHEFFLSQEEKLFQLLEIPYQVVKMCSGDLGFPTARKYDLEAWIPSQKKYREVTSTSTTTDFQSRRLNIKYREKGETKFVHIINGTAFAIGRTLIAILENYQQKDGSIIVPKVLQSYTGFSKIEPK